MALMQLACFLAVVAVCGMAQGQSCYGRVRTVVPVGPPPCPCGGDDLGALIQLVKALNDDGDTDKGLDVEDLIMKLVNALIYTTTQGGGGGAGGTGGSGGSGGSGSGSLIDLGLLGTMSNGGLSVANLGLGKTGVLNVGLGGTA